VRRAIPLLISAVLLAALIAPQAAAAADPQDQIVISGDVDVPRGQTVGDVVVVDGQITAAGRIDGDVVAVSGPVRIAGTVDGSITALSDRVTLLPGARVTGDLLYGDERPVIAPSATVAGEVSDEGWSDVGAFPWGIVGALAWWLAVSVSTLALGFLALALAPRAADALVATAHERLGVSVAVGAGLFIALPVVAVIALVSLVGLPLGLGLLLALIPLAGLAYVTSAHLIGRRLLKPTTSSFVAFLAGWGVLRAVALVPVVGVLAGLAAVVTGLGVLLVALWQSRGTEVRPEMPASTPPAPTQVHA
jgi:hypothetical protein